MPVSNQYETVDPERIVVKRDERQRRAVNIDDLELSIKEHGVINPIIVQRDGMVLVAGERRLTACKKLGVPIPIRYFDTLSPLEASLVEFEENEKRHGLTWQDRAITIARIHGFLEQDAVDWSHAQTASKIGISRQTAQEAIELSDYVLPGSSDFLADIAAAPGWTEALTRVRRRNKQLGDRVMNDMIAGEVSGPSPFPTSADNSAESPVPRANGAAVPPTSPDIICADFLEWAPKFTGRPFNLIHCDFPYGGRVFDGRQMSDYSEVYEDDPKVYWALLKCLCENRGRLLTHHGFVVIWFSMIHYTETIRFLHKNASDLAVDPRPFVWLKSDNAGVCPDPRRKLRQTYETALLCRRNDAHYQNVVSNAYTAPTARQLHPSAKPQPVLTHFFRAMVDNHTRLLDPTCGSGTALCAADAMGAEYVFGMDVDKEHVENAISKLRSQRALAAVSKQMKKQ